MVVSHQNFTCFAWRTRCTTHPFSLFSWYKVKWIQRLLHEIELFKISNKILTTCTATEPKSSSSSFLLFDIFSIFYRLTLPRRWAASHYPLCTHRFYNKILSFRLKSCVCIYWIEFCILILVIIFLSFFFLRKY